MTAKYNFTQAYMEDGDTYEESYVYTHSDGVYLNNEETKTLSDYIEDRKFENARGTATAITLNVGELVTGYSKTFIAKANNNGSATTINGKPLYKPATTIAPTLKANKAYTVWFNEDSDCFFFKASAEGNATAENVLADKTFSNDDDTSIVGTMPNNGSINKTLVLNGSYTIPKGYHDGTGKVTQSITTKGAITDSVSNVVSGDALYSRIPQGAYFTNASSGYPEIKTAVSSLTSVLQSASQSIKENMITELGGLVKQEGTLTRTDDSGVTTVTLGYRPKMVICMMAKNNQSFYFDLGQELCSYIPTRVRFVANPDGNWGRYYWDWPENTDGTKEYGIEITDNGFTYNPIHTMAGEFVRYIAFR